MGLKSCIYSADIDRPEDYMYDADMSPKSYMYTPDVGLVPNIWNAGVLYVGSKGFIYATGLQSDHCIL